MRTHSAVSHPTRRTGAPTSTAMQATLLAVPILSGQERPAEGQHEGQDEGHLQGAHEGADVVHRRTINTMPMTTSNADSALRTVGGERTDCNRAPIEPPTRADAATSAASDATIRPWDA